MQRYVYNGYKGRKANIQEQNIWKDFETPKKIWRCRIFLLKTVRESVRFVWSPNPDNGKQTAFQTN